jgi:uncharacterized membrane protein YdbT with pleckstrin-like domain
MTTPSMTTETTLWQGSPSQWLNIGHHLIALLAAAAAVAGGIFFPPAWALLVIPLGYIAWRYLVVRCQRYQLTSERLRVTKGVLNQHIDEIELYRVKDIQMSRAFWMRLTGLSSLHLETSDRSLPLLVIPAVRGGTELREQLRKQVEELRDRKRVREMDFDETTGHADELADAGGDDGAPMA